MSQKSFKVSRINNAHGHESLGGIAVYLPRNLTGLWSYAINQIKVCKTIFEFTDDRKIAP